MSKTLQQKGVKTCSKCKQTKPRSEFGRNRTAYDGLAHYCLDCNRSHSQKQRDKFRETHYKDVSPIPVDSEEGDSPASLSLWKNRVSALERELKKEKARTDALLDTAREILEPLKIAPLVKPYKPKKTYPVLPEAQVALVSDLQGGKETTTYNLEVLDKRMNLFFENVVKLADITRSHHPVHDLYIMANGDLVEGEGIFPGQAWETQAYATKQSISVAQILSIPIARIAPNYRNVYVTFTPGNHGRVTKDWNPLTNFDLICGEFVKYELSKIKNVHVDVIYDWYKIVDVNGIKVMVTHGDRIRVAGDTPVTSVVKRVARWKQSVPVPEPIDLKSVLKEASQLGDWQEIVTFLRRVVTDPFEVICFGHWHNFFNFLWNGAEVFINGSPESDNTYALSHLGMASEPNQTVFFVHPKHRVSARYLVRLGDDTN